MTNPFKKVEPLEDDVALTKAEGRFGCYEKGCGKVVGYASYQEDTEILTFTCPDGHKNTVNIKI